MRKTGYVEHWNDLLFNYLDYKKSASGVGTREEVIVMDELIDIVIRKSGQSVHRLDYLLGALEAAQEQTIIDQ